MVGFQPFFMMDEEWRECGYLARWTVHRGTHDGGTYDRSAIRIWLAWRSLVKRWAFVYLIIDGWDDDGGIEHSICIA